jgi:hypothetical protein
MNAVMIRVAEALARIECSFESSTNNENSVKLSDCRRCADLEQQLHKAINDVSFARLMIDLFNTEHNQGSMDMGGTN